MRFFSYLVTLLAVALLASCGGGGGSPGTIQNSVDFFSTAPAALTLTLGSARSFTLGGGTGPYSAVSSDASVAVAGVAGSTVTLGGVKPGIASITLTDSKGASIKTSVTVKPTLGLFTLIPSPLTLAVGVAGAQTYQVGGGVPPYKVLNTNPTVVSAVLNASGDSITLTGLAAGVASVGISDSNLDTFVSNVTVTATSGVALFTTAPSAVTLIRGSFTTYSIGGGTPPYSVTSSNTGVASVTQSGSTFTVKGVAIGSASIVVRDDAGTTRSIAVTVEAATLTVNPDKATVPIGFPVYTYIVGGTGPYTAVSTFPTVATVAIGTLNASGNFVANANGNVVKMVANQAADPDQIVITDALGNTVNFALTSNTATPQESLTPNALSVSSCYLGDITLLLSGSTGTVNVFSTDTTLITAAVTNPSSNPVVITATKIVADQALTGSVSITAIDGSGSSATSTITIIPSAAACP
jgi:hypothetical protein